MFDLIADGDNVNNDICSQQLQRVNAILKAHYPALVNRRCSLQEQDNVPEYSVNVNKRKLEGLQVL